MYSDRRGAHPAINRSSSDDLHATINQSVNRRLSGVGAPISARLGAHPGPPPPVEPSTRVRRGRVAPAGATRPRSRQTGRSGSLLRFGELTHGLAFATNLSNNGRLSYAFGLLSV